MVCSMIFRKLNIAIILSGLAAFGLSGCAEVESLRMIKAEQDRRIAELEKRLESVAQESVNVKREQDDQLAAQKQQIADLQEALRDAQERRTKREMDLEQQLAQVKGDLERRNEELRLARKTNERLAEELETLKGRVTALQTAADKDTKQLDELQKNLEAVKELKAGLENKVDDLEEKAEEAKRLKTMLEAETVRADTQEKNVERLSTQVRNLTEALKKVDSLNSETSEQFKAERVALEKEAARLQSQVEKMRKGTVILDSDIEEAENQLKSSLKPLSDADFVQIFTDDRGLVIRLDAGYLFESGAVTVDPQVLSTLEEIGRVLGKYEDKYVEVQGHTDATPITSMPFADNWALASARADNVVRYLANQTPIKASRIKSVAVAQYRPTDDGKMLRRVEIIFSPRP